MSGRCRQTYRRSSPNADRSSLALQTYPARRRVEALAQINAPHVRIGDDLLRRPFRHDAAGVEDVGAVDQAERLAHVVVGDEHADAAAGQMPHQPWISPTAIGSMPAKGSSSSMKAGRLASARAISQRRRSPPDSEIAGAFREMRDVELLEQRIEVALAQLPVGLDDLEHGADVVLDRQPAEDRRLLRQVADAEARAPIHRQMRHVEAVDLDAARHRDGSAR